MQIFKKTITVTQEDLDQLNHVNNVLYVQWVQDIAEEHWLQNATKDILNNFFWVLIKHEISYKNQAVLDDELVVSTYVTKSEGITSERHVEFLNKSTNKIIVKSITKWCLMSSESKRPTRIPDHIITLFD